LPGPRDDSPTCGVSEAKWIEVFKRAGLFTYPPVGTGRPSARVTVYCGATAERAARMPWAAERNIAVQLGARHTRYVRTWLYEATVRPNAVLAYLERRGEGWTVVVNPAGLSQIGRGAGSGGGGKGVSRLVGRVLCEHVSDLCRSAAHVH
jgi:hypothetical protein